MLLAALLAGQVTGEIVWQTFYRGAQAALQLKEFEKAQQLCQQGLELATDNSELRALAEASKRHALRPSYCHHRCINFLLTGYIMMPLCHALQCFAELLEP